MSDTSQGDGWWIAADGKWYPPEAAQSAASPPAGSPGGQGNPGGLITFLGWFVAAAGLGVVFATVSELSSNDNDFLDLSFGDYLISMSPGLTVLGIGVAAAGLGGILSRTR